MYHGFYGKSQLLQAPFRTDKGGGKSDFITVGKIDNGNAGIFNVNKNLSYSEMIRQWIFLNDSKKKEHLLDIFNQEKKSIVTMITNWKKFHSGPPIFEIANEPNLFPYISPELYAQYYALWYDEIRFYEPNALIMNGGLWCNDVIPKKIVKLLSLLGIKEKNTWNYFKKFTNSLPSIYHIPDIINLHVYPYCNKIDELEQQIKNIEFFKVNFKQTWITEYGNINSFGMEKTVKFISRLYALLSMHHRTERAYYFQAKYSERNFQLFYELNKRYRQQRFYKRISQYTQFIFRRKSSLIYMFNNYIKNPPIQSIETKDQKNLNLIGKWFKKYVHYEK